MLQTLKKFFAFCGADNRKLFVISIWLGVVSAICSAMRIPAAAIVIQALLQKNVTMATLWASLSIIAASLIVTIAINMKATMLQTRAEYRACANKRIEIAEHLRYLPMGWFNDNSLGGHLRHHQHHGKYGECRHPCGHGHNPGIFDLRHYCGHDVPL
mgnify:CR=1 FL=1